MDWLEMESLLFEVANNLDHSPIHAGAARDFVLTLENYSEDSRDAEVMVSFVVRLWEDDDNEISLIVQSVSEELENTGLLVEEIGFQGSGPPRKN